MTEEYVIASVSAAIHTLLSQKTTFYYNHHTVSVIARGRKSHPPVIASKRSLRGNPHVKPQNGVLIVYNQTGNFIIPLNLPLIYHLTLYCFLTFYLAPFAEK
ncbi:MAG: hypothetical protein LBF71_00830 [Campylobacteraceae bacterium]|nr:hypothetical protein [Campylobacteraceae bacterium]